MSVAQTKDGRWRVRVYAGFEGGKRRLIDKVVATEREAKKVEAQLRSDLEQKRYVPPSRKPLAEYLDEWLARADVKPRTRQRYEQLVRVHVKPAIGSVPLSKLVDVAELLASMRGRVSDGTRLHVYRALHRALELARKWKLIPANPCDDVEPPRCNEATMRILSPEEERLLLAAARGELRGPERTGPATPENPRHAAGVLLCLVGTTGGNCPHQ